MFPQPFPSYLPVATAVPRFSLSTLHSHSLPHYFHPQTIQGTVVMDIMVDRNTICAARRGLSVSIQLPRHIDTPKQSHKYWSFRFHADSVD